MNFSNQISWLNFLKELYFFRIWKLLIKGFYFSKLEISFDLKYEIDIKQF